MAEIDDRASKMMRICALWSRLPPPARAALLWRAWALIYGRDRVWEIYRAYRVHIIGRINDDNNQGGLIVLH